MALLAAESICSADTGRKYTVVRALGHGAFGEVLLVEDAETQQQYAAKQLYMRDQEDQLPLPVLRELTALQQLQHPNSVALLDTATDGPCFFLIQELCRTDIAAMLSAANRHLPPAVVKSIMQQLLRALAACHEQGLMHRDVKPSNLLVTADGMLKLGDFGLTRSYRSADGPQHPQQEVIGPGAAPRQQDKQEQHNTWSQLQREQQSITEDLSRQLQLGTVQQQQRWLPEPQLSGCLTAAQGTRWYRAPELLFGSRTYGPAVDMWSAGMVFAEILGLSPLIPGQSDIDQLARMQQTLGSITVQHWPEVEQLPDWHKIKFGHSPGQRLSELLPDAPTAALDLLQGMICYNPSRRLTAAAALQHRYFSDAPAAAEPKQVAAVCDDILQQAMPVMPQCQASFAWSDVIGSESDGGGSVD